MDWIKRAFERNRQLKRALELLFNELNQGQQKKVLKNKEVKYLLTKFKIINKD